MLDSFEKTLPVVKAPIVAAQQAAERRAKELEKTLRTQAGAAEEAESRISDTQRGAEARAAAPRCTPPRRKRRRLRSSRR